MLDFGERGKPECLKKKPLRATTRTNNKLNPHLTRSPGIEPQATLGGVECSHYYTILLPQKINAFLYHQRADAKLLLSAVIVQCTLFILRQFKLT